MKAKDIMSHKVVTINSESTVEQAAKKMLDNKVGGLPVVDDGQIQGIITESDFIGKRVNIPHGISSIPELLGHWLSGVSVESVLKEARKTPVKNVMNKDLVFVSPDTPLTKIVSIMMDRELNRLPVIEGGKLVGIIARRDILAAFDKLKV